MQTHREFASGLVLYRKAACFSMITPIVKLEEDDDMRLWGDIVQPLAAKLAVPEKERKRKIGPAIVDPLSDLEREADALLSDN